MYVNISLSQYYENKIIFKEGIEFFLDTLYDYLYSYHFEKDPIIYYQKSFIDNKDDVCCRLLSKEGNFYELTYRSKDEIYLELSTSPTRKHIPRKRERHTSTLTFNKSFARHIQYEINLGAEYNWNRDDPKKRDDVYILELDKKYIKFSDGTILQSYHKENNNHYIVFNPHILVSYLNNTNNQKLTFDLNSDKFFSISPQSGIILTSKQGLSFKLPAFSHDHSNDDLNLHLVHSDIYDSRMYGVPNCSSRL